MPDKYIVFYDAKNALLSYYQSQQTNQIARLLGSSVVLFTFIQILQSTTRISTLFPTITNSISAVIGDSAWIEILRLLLLFVGLTVIFAVMVYSLGRFSLYSQFSCYLLGIRYEDIDNPLEVFNEAVWTKTKGAKSKLLWAIPLTSFASAGEETNPMRNTNRKGWQISLALGALLSLIVMWIFW
jgi:hypothetical protein